jgi:hypothetical protein
MRGPRRARSRSGRQRLRVQEWSVSAPFRVRRAAGCDAPPAPHRWPVDDRPRDRDSPQDNVGVGYGGPPQPDRGEGEQRQEGALGRSSLREAVGRSGPA